MCEVPNAMNAIEDPRGADAEDNKMVVKCRGGKEDSCSKKDTCLRYDHDDVDGAWFACNFDDYYLPKEEENDLAGED